MLLIIDALVKQGSYPRYIVDNNSVKKYIYSEHSGVLNLTSNDKINNVVVSTESSRIDSHDTNIYLPINTDILSKHEFLFHTHPNTTTYAGRMNEGIIYELPSANDILNFVKYHNNGVAQASIIAAPEGIYVVRLIVYEKQLDITMEFLMN